jgi:hypothetical protein
MHGGYRAKTQPLAQDLSGQIRVLYTNEASFRTRYEIVDSRLQFKLLPSVMEYHACFLFTKLCNSVVQLSRSGLEAVIAGTRAISAPLPVVLFIKVLQKCLPPAFSLQEGDTIISHIFCVQ